MQHSSAIQLLVMIFISTFVVNLPLWILAAVIIKAILIKRNLSTCLIVDDRYQYQDIADLTAYIIPLPGGGRGGFN